MKPNRIAIFSGHYGSGKTSLALSYALELGRRGHPALLVDLDIVNPYFRSKDHATLLEKEGVGLISSAFAGTNVDVPSIPPEARRMFDEKERFVVIDVGGDDRGALALGRYAGDIRREGSFDMFLVVNKYRPLTSDGKSAVEVAREIEAASKIPFTAVINNSNLGAETTPKTVTSSAEYAEEIAKLLSLPLVRTTVTEEVFRQMKGEVENLESIRLFPKEEWRL